MALKMQDEHVLCRSRMLGGHDWQVGRKLGKKASLGTLLSLRCTRCGMWRHDTISTYGGLVTRHYEQPDGYHMPADEQPSGDELRLRMLKIIDKGIKQGTLLDLIAIEEEEATASRGKGRGRATNGHKTTNGNGSKTKGRRLVAVS